MGCTSLQSLYSPRLRSSLARLVILYTLLISLLLGAPVWWITTDVYRASLPAIDLADTERIESIPIRVHLHLLHTEKSAVTPENAESLRANLYSSFAAIVKASRRFAPISINKLHLATSLIDIPSTDSVQETDKWIGEQVSKELISEPQNGHYNLVILIKPSIEKPIAVISSRRHAWIQVSTLNEAKSSLPTLTAQLRHMLLNEVKLENLRKQSYRFVFSLLNEDPSSTITTWNFADLETHYLQDVIQTFKRVHEIGVESQVVHYAQLKRSPFYDQTTRDYYFTPATLPRFVEGTEWKVDSGSSAKENTLHFAVFVPSPSHSPLVIKNGGHTISTGFTTPQWGGVVILNLPNEQRPTNFEIDRSSFVAPLQVFVSQMRQLMGIPTFSANIVSPSKTFENIIILPAVKKGASDWEIDALSRRHIWNMLKETQHTLTQFTRMMDQIPNIPIYDHIHDTLQHALTKRSTTLEILAKPSQHDIAHSAISDALTSSEDVFFDKDMVGMLYFPSGHQLAIYVPLFLPLCFPIITGLRNEWSIRKQKRATK